MTAAFELSRDRAPRRAIDVGLLPVVDRACLRLLGRCEAATPEQLARLIYRSRRTAQKRLRRLWQLGLVERALLPPAPGGITVAYRVSVRGRERLAYPARQREGVTHLRHTLDTVEAVCALVGDNRDDLATLPVGLWLTESMGRDVLGGDVHPDAILALDHAGGSAVVCLEVDEATQHGPIIQGKLEAYEHALTGRAAWHLLFVAPNADRVDWIRTLARGRLGQTAGRGWAVTLGALRAGGPNAPLRSLSPGRDEPPLGTLATDRRRRRSLAPVGSAAWVELLGNGGAEDTAALA
jgi:predicted transcriptional regulator